MLQDSPSNNNHNLIYSFNAIRRHVFNDKVYHVHVYMDCITIGEVFNDPNPKYVVELNLKNIIYWKLQYYQEKAFAIKYKNGIKYFDANYEHLCRFREAITCKISFSSLDDHYKIDEMIGKGSFSSVYRIFRLKDNKVFAMKYVSSKQKHDKENMQLLENEINILHSLNSEQIINIYEVYKVELNHYAIIIEYIEGQCLAQTIEGLKKQTLKLKEQDIKIIIQQLLKAMAYLHSQQVIHRDIKPQNIMFTGPDLKNIKIIDFGLSIKNQNQFNRCGTPGYMAPEIVNMRKDNQKAWTFLCDIFSLGVVFYKLLSRGQSCFSGQTSDQVLINNKKCQIDYQNVTQHGYSRNAVNLLKLMLSKVPEERISAIQALRHPFFSDLAPISFTEYPNYSISHISYVTNLLGHQDMEILKEDIAAQEFSASEKIQEIYKLKAKPSRISRLTNLHQPAQKKLNYKKINQEKQQKSQREPDNS